MLKNVMVVRQRRAINFQDKSPYRQVKIVTFWKKSNSKLMDLGWNTETIILCIPMDMLIFFFFSQAVTSF